MTSTNGNAEYSQYLVCAGCVVKMDLRFIQMGTK